MCKFGSNLPSFAYPNLIITPDEKTKILKKPRDGDQTAELDALSEMASRIIHVQCDVVL